ncbi:MAG TPA: hypothetical protein VMJ10_36420 [Kofleriaceae bacterium]|nr:hypothetical protein [Kofleriaceae bacterium]
MAVTLVFGCAAPAALAPSAPAPLPPPMVAAIDTTPKERRRMMPPEVYLRAYLGWFGGLAPLDVQAKARGKNMFDSWDDYLAALGLPDYKVDLPRQSQSNTLMIATLGRLGEALCVRAAEHDLHGKTPAAARVVFAFQPVAAPDDAQFAERFDVLHRLFLGYPVRLAPSDRAAHFFALYRAVAAQHAGKKGPLTPDETAWAAVCTALVQHPEAELY